MEIGLDGGGAHEGLAEADQAFVRVEPDPDEIGEFGKANGFEGGDFHGDAIGYC
jgi:hypothetical protein